MILIDLTDKYVHFTVCDEGKGKNKLEEEKQFLDNALRKSKLHPGPRPPSATPSKYETYIPIAEFNSLDEIRCLFIPDVGNANKKAPIFFHEPPVNYKFADRKVFSPAIDSKTDSKNKFISTTADILIEKKINEVKSKIEKPK